MGVCERVHMCTCAHMHKMGEGPYMVVGDSSVRLLFSFHFTWVPEMGLKSPGLQGTCLHLVKCLVDTQEFGLGTRFVHK